MRPVAEGEVPRGSGGARNGFASMEGKYNPACEWLEFHYPVACRTFLNVQKLYSQEMLNPSLLTVIIYSLHILSYPFSRNMPKPKPPSLRYSNYKIEAEKLAVLKRTETKIAEILRLCPTVPEPEPDVTSQFPKIEVAILLFVLLLYTALTLFKKCECMCTV